MLQEAMDEIAAREQLDQDFGKLPEPEQPPPLCVQAPAVVLQETAPTAEEQMEGASEAVQPREARGTTPILDFARLTVSTLDRREVMMPPVAQEVLPPLPEQVAPVDVEMAAEEVATEETEEEDVLGEAQALFGKKEKDLTEGE